MAFKSQWGFIMAAVGSCVGMANVWRFPMLVSEVWRPDLPDPLFYFCIYHLPVRHDGRIFAWPLGGCGPSGAFGKAMENGGKSKKVGEWLGAIPILGALCLAIGYSVIMGWVFYWTKMAFTGELTAMGQDMGCHRRRFRRGSSSADSLGEAIMQTFQTGGANNFWIIIGVVASFAIMVFGVAGGIEKACKVMIPALYVLFIALAVLMIFTPGTGGRLQYIFTLDPEGPAQVRKFGSMHSDSVSSRCLLRVPARSFTALILARMSRSVSRRLSVRSWILRQRCWQCSSSFPLCPPLVLTLVTAALA